MQRSEGGLEGWLGLTCGVQIDKRKVDKRKEGSLFGWGKEKEEDNE